MNPNPDTELSTQYIKNRSFDSDQKVLAVEALGINPDDNELYRLACDANGRLKIDSTDVDFWNGLINDTISNTVLNNAYDATNNCLWVNEQNPNPTAPGTYTNRQIWDLIWDDVNQQIRINTQYLETPPEFPFEPPFKIKWNSGSSKYDTDGFNIDDYIPDNSVTYYVSTTGSDTTGDGTSANRWRSIDYALSQVDYGQVGKIIVGTGTYYMGTGWENYIMDRSVSIIAENDDEVIISPHWNITSWTASGGAYYADMSGFTGYTTKVYSLFDAGILTSYGDYTRYTAAASVAACQSTQSTYYYDSGSDRLYVHRADDSDPTTNIRAYPNVTTNARCQGKINIYLSHIKLYGGNYAFFASTGVQAVEQYKSAVTAADHNINSSTSTRAAQSFTFSKDQYIYGFTLRLKKVSGTYGNLVVRFETNDNGKPSGTLVDPSAYLTLTPTDSSWSGTSYSWLSNYFSVPFPASRDTVYWMVLQHETEGSGDSVYSWQGDDAGAYPKGNSSYYASGTWTSDTSKDQIFYIRNIPLQGNAPSCYFDTCEFKYTQAGDGLSIDAGENIIVYNSTASSTFDDGFNYHAKVANLIDVPNVIEIDCDSQYTGISGGNDNGSTAHDGVNIIRINGTYTKSVGPVVADINGSKTWLLNCIMSDSTNTSGVRNVNYYCDDLQSSRGTVLQNGSYTYMDRCTFSGSDYDINATINASWATSTVYSVGTDVLQSGSLYNCLIAHTSGVFATDLAAGKWELIDSAPVSTYVSLRNTTVGAGRTTGSGTIDSIYYKDQIKVQPITDTKVKASYTDTVPNYLDEKITQGRGITLYKSGDGNETIRLDNDLSTGVEGGQTVFGGLSAYDDLYLSSTSSSAKGYIYLSDTSYFVEASDQLKITGSTPNQSITYTNYDTGNSRYGTGAGAFIALYLNDGTNLPKSGDRLGLYGLGGTAIQSAIASYSVGDWDGSNKGSSLSFEITPQDSTTRSSIINLTADNSTSKSPVLTASYTNTSYKIRGNTSSGTYARYTQSGTSAYVTNNAYPTAANTFSADATGGATYIKADRGTLEIAVNSTTNADNTISWTSALNVANTGAVTTNVSLTSSTIYGSAASGGDLTLYSTSHATKGNIFFGTSTYDEVNNRLGLATTTPQYMLDVNGGIRIIDSGNLWFGGTAGAADADVNLYRVAANSLKTDDAFTATQFTSTVAVGTQPYACTSTTENTNLNAQLWGGNDSNATVAQGDVLYGSAAGVVSNLAKDANATRYLSNTGTSNNPAWAQVNLANGVTGTLPYGNGGTGTATFPQDKGIMYFDGTNSRIYNSTEFYLSSSNNVILSTASGSSFFSIWTGTYGSSSGGANGFYLNDATNQPSSGNRMGGIGWGGKRNADTINANGAAIFGYASENWSATTQATELKFEMTPLSSTTRSAMFTLGTDNSTSNAPALTGSFANISYKIRGNTSSGTYARYTQSGTSAWVTNNAYPTGSDAFSADSSAGAAAIELDRGNINLLVAASATANSAITWITPLAISNTGQLTYGAGAAGVDYAITFNGETNDGVLTWMEDEDYFQFSDDIMLPDNELVKLGTGVDMSIGYTGTVGRIDTSLVAASDLQIDCGTDKTIVLDETVYQDINMSSAMVNKPASGYPDVDEFVDEAGADTGIETYAFGVNEKVSGQFEIQHDYKEGTDLTFHVHWQGIAAPDGGTDNVKWQLKYTVSRDGTTLDAATTITKESAITTRYAFVRSDFTAITGTNFKIGDQFLFQLSRIAASSDEYAGDALLSTCGVHYEIDTLGSRQIGTK